MTVDHHDGYQYAEASAMAVGQNRWIGAVACLPHRTYGRRIYL